MHEDERWLDRGWQWLDDHPDDERYEQAEDAWLQRLAMYEQAYRLTYGEGG